MVKSTTFVLSGYLGLQILLICTAYAEEVCDKDQIECRQSSVVSKTLEDNEEVSSLVTKIFDLAVLYSSDFGDYKRLTSLLDYLRLHQLEVTEHLPKRTSQEDALNDFNTNFVQKYVIVDGLEAVYYPGMGVGIRTTRDIDVDEELISISVEHVLSAQQSEDDFACLGDITFKDAKFPGLWRVTNLTLLLLQHAFSKDSIFESYINVLPSTFSHATYFSDDEMESLKGSVVFEGSLNTVQELAAVYSSIWTSFNRNPECADAIGIPFEKFTLDVFRWAFTVTLTRNYDGSFIDGQRNKVMIPFWDFFNHKLDADLDTYNEFEGDDKDPKPKGSYITYSTRSIPAGKQVFMHYLSPLDPNEAFSTWGFVEINEIALPMVPEILDEAGQTLAASWSKEDGLSVLDPDTNSRIIKLDDFEELVDIVSGKVGAEIKPGTVRKAWTLVLKLIDAQVANFAHELHYYEEVCAKNDISGNSKLICTQIVEEIKFLRKIREHIVTVVLA